MYVEDNSRRYWRTGTGIVEVRIGCLSLRRKKRRFEREKEMREGDVRGRWTGRTFNEGQEIPLHAF